MKTRKNKPEEMILYRCPYCGVMQLKSVTEVENRDMWSCTMCGCRMESAS